MYPTEDLDSANILQENSQTKTLQYKILPTLPFCCLFEIPQMLKYLCKLRTHRASRLSGSGSVRLDPIRVFRLEP